MLSVFLTKQAVKSSSCLKWSSKITAPTLDLDQNVLLEAEVHMICCRIRVLIHFRLCFSIGGTCPWASSSAPSADFELQHSIFNTQTCPFSIHLVKERKKFHFIYSLIVFHCPFPGLASLFTWLWRDNETWPADTFQSRKFLVEQGDIHSVPTPKGRF